MKTMRARLLDLTHIQDNITHMNEAGQSGELFELEKSIRLSIINEICCDYETLLSALERVEIMTRQIAPVLPVVIWNTAKVAIDAVKK